MLTPHTQVQGAFERKQVLLEEARLRQLAREATRDRDQMPGRLARLVRDLFTADEPVTVAEPAAEVTSREQAG